MRSRSSAWLRMFSNQMPAERVLASSWRDSSICSSRDKLSHNGVPYSDTIFGGRKNLSGSSGACQSMSTIGAYDFLTEPFSRRSENSSRPAAALAFTEAVIADVPSLLSPRKLGTQCRRCQYPGYRVPSVSTGQGVGSRPGTADAAYSHP